MQIGDIVSVTGSLTVDPTADATSTIVRINLPVATNNFTTTHQLSGSAIVEDGGPVHTGVSVYGAVSTQEALFLYSALGTANDNIIRFSFSYEIQ